MGGEGGGGDIKCTYPNKNLKYKRLGKGAILETAIQVNVGIKLLLKYNVLVNNLQNYHSLILFCTKIDTNDLHSRI